MINTFRTGTMTSISYYAKKKVISNVIEWIHCLVVPLPELMVMIHINPDSKSCWLFGSSDLVFILSSGKKEIVIITILRHRCHTLPKHLCVLSRFPFSCFPIVLQLFALAGWPTQYYSRFEIRVMVSTPLFLLNSILGTYRSRISLA